MAKDYFPCRYSYRPILEAFDDAEVGKLFKALLKYGDTGERSDLPGKEQVAFEFIAADLDRANEAYERKCKALSENGRKGGRPSKANGFSEKQMVSEESKESNCKQIKPIKENKIKENKSNIFIKPTAEEVNAYCQERNNGIDGQHFVDYYEARGWKAGNQPMKDWKAAVRTWERNGYSKPVQEKKVTQTIQTGTAWEHGDSELRAIEELKRWKERRAT